MQHIQEARRKAGGATLAFTRSYVHAPTNAAAMVCVIQKVPANVSVRTVEKIVQQKNKLSCKQVWLYP
jgi:hypothetical protein